MLRSLSALIARAYADGFEKVWASGDMTWEMGNQGNLAELLEYERGLERLFQLHPGFSGVCQYHRDTLPTSAIRDALCSHQSVYLNQTLFRLNPYYEEAEIPAGVPTELQDLIERFRQHQ
jgi:hypothetical protein